MSVTFNGILPVKVVITSQTSSYQLSVIVEQLVVSSIINVSADGLTD